MEFKDQLLNALDAMEERVMITDGGKLIKYHRSQLGLSMAKLSEAMREAKTPLSKTSISDIENGKQKPTKATLRALCAIFGVEYKAFLKLLVDGVDERYYKAVVDSIR